MLTRSQLEKYADLLIWGLKTARKKTLKPKDVVTVRYAQAADGLAEALYERLIDSGYHAVIRPTPKFTMEKIFYERASVSQLEFLPPGEAELLEVLAGAIYIRAPESLTHLRRTDPAKFGRAAVARKPFKDILNRREDEGLFGWTLCEFPTQAVAEQAQMTLPEYARQIVRGCYLDVRDPVAKWNEIHDAAKEIKTWLNKLKIRTVRVESENVDLSINLGEKRRWVGISGHNIPSFEIFTSPDWRGASGRFFSNLPSYRTGNYVEDLRLTFEEGNVVKVTARKGQKFVQKQIEMDAGGRRIGEFSLTDKRFSRIDRFMANTLFDENHGGKHGNCHIALGAAYSDTFSGSPKTLTEESKRDLGFNDSALHWDFVNTEDKRVTATVASGKQVVIYENGMFKV